MEQVCDKRKQWRTVIKGKMAVRQICHVGIHLKALTCLIRTTGSELVSTHIGIQRNWSQGGILKDSCFSAEFSGPSGNCSRPIGIVGDTVSLPDQQHQ